MLLTAPCLSPSQGLPTCSYHPSGLNQHLPPLHCSIPQHRGKPTLFYHPILHLLPRHRLPSKTNLLQILLRYSLLSPLPWSFCPSHSTVTGLAKPIIKIHTSWSSRHSSVLILANIPGTFGILDSCVLYPSVFIFQGRGAYVTPKYPNCTWQGTHSTLCPLWPGYCMGSLGSNEIQAKEDSIPVTVGNGPQRQWQAEVRGLRQGRCDKKWRGTPGKGGVHRIHTWDSRGHTVQWPNGVFGQMGGCSLGISFSGADLGACFVAGEIQGSALHHVSEKWGKGPNPDKT